MFATHCMCLQLNNYRLISGGTGVCVIGTGIRTVLQTLGVVIPNAGTFPSRPGILTFLSTNTDKC
jgi:hypothetical protein